MGIGRRVESGLLGLVTVGVAVVGMAAGFTHTHGAAVRAGQTGWLAWADAVVIELMVIVAGWEIHRRRRADRPIGFPATVLVIAFGVQMGAQVSGAPAHVAGWLFAAIPALGALVIIKMSLGAGTESREVPAGREPTEVGSVHADAIRDTEDAPALEPATPAAAPAWPPR